MPQSVLTTIRRSLTEYDVADHPRPAIVMLKTVLFDKLRREMMGQIPLDTAELKGARYEEAGDTVTIDGVMIADEDG